jgi:hypothetical protein
MPSFNQPDIAVARKRLRRLGGESVRMHVNPK